jgi:hypothetical protein
MKFEIKNRFSGAIIFSIETVSMSLCVAEAIKSGADLSRANLYYANLSDANLYCANLSRANLPGANLSRANLSGANLFGANLSDANLSGADLSGANLFGANLFGANLSDANLSGANLFGADLFGALNSEIVIARTQICPQEGAFVGWKKLKGDVIARLVIPHDAERVNAMSSRKCRASKAFVHELFGADEAFDTHTGKLLYKNGCEVIPDKFDNDVRVECSHGIHFFITREEAEVKDEI